MPGNRGPVRSRADSGGAVRQRAAAPPQGVARTGGRGAHAGGRPDPDAVRITFSELVTPGMALAGPGGGTSAERVCVGHRQRTLQSAVTELLHSAPGETVMAVKLLLQLAAIQRFSAPAAAIDAIARVHRISDQNWLRTWKPSCSGPRHASLVRESLQGGHSDGLRSARGHRGPAGRPPAAVFTDPATHRRKPLPTG